MQEEGDATCACAEIEDAEGGGAGWGDGGGEEGGEVGEPVFGFGAGGGEC